MKATAQVRPGRPKVGFRLTAPVPYGTPHSGNLIIKGENLTALTVLASELSNAVKCIYIDPPYNNQEKYRHYDDALTHKGWLAELEPRLRALKETLRPDGSLWMSIDDGELHYLKVAADTVFGRANFITTIVWQHRITRENRKVFSNNHEYILVYAKNATEFRKSRNGLVATDALLRRYRNVDQDPRGPWQSVSATVQAGHATPAQFYELQAPNGRRYAPPKGRCWAYSKRRMENEIRLNNVFFGKSGYGVPRLKWFLGNKQLRLTPESLWLAADVGTSDSAKKHVLSILKRAAIFDTPKPEQLIARVLEIATDPGDLVLDAYLGSGTTASVAHKMGRRYIGIEKGAHVATHCVARLRKVIAGEPGGISGAVRWTGGGGFDFARLVRDHRDSTDVRRGLRVIRGKRT